MENFSICWEKQLVVKMFLTPNFIVNSIFINRSNKKQTQEWQQTSSVASIKFSTWSNLSQFTLREVHVSLDGFFNSFEKKLFRTFHSKDHFHKSHFKEMCNLPNFIHPMWVNCLMWFFNCFRLHIKCCEKRFPHEKIPFFILHMQRQRR